MMDNDSSDDFSRAWDEILKMFRALGGAAENLGPRRESAARGLMPNDPDRPVWLHVPAELMINVNDIEFAQNRIRVKATANVMEAQRLLFEKYHDVFSWGRYGRSESERIISGLDALPEPVREVLRDDFECGDLLEGDVTARAQKRFVRSCSLRRGDSEYVVPFLDLAHHDSAGLPCQFGRDVDIRGQARDEIRIAFGAHDSFSAFWAFGDAQTEPGAFSMPLALTVKEPEILIQHHGNRLVPRGTDWVPRVSLGEKRIELSCVMIGHVKFPRLSRGIFCTLLHEAGYDDPDDAFDRILRYNWGLYLKLFDVLEPYQGDLITTLRRMARYQLETMSHCIGCRELESLAPSTARPERSWSMSIS